MKIVAQVIKEFPTVYGTRIFITPFTSSCHCSLSWARWIQSTHSHTIYLKSMLILPSCVCVCVCVSEVIESLQVYGLKFCKHVPYRFCCNHPNNSWCFEAPHYTGFSILLLFSLLCPIILSTVIKNIFTPCGIWNSNGDEFRSRYSRFWHRIVMQ
jgi:hypothetical protein